MSADRKDCRSRRGRQHSGAEYRARLGWLLGHRFVYIAHRGRRSGVRREVVVEVVRYLPASAEIAVVAAWGDHPDWYLNLKAGPAIEVRICTQVWRQPSHRFLGAADTARLLHSYERAHPWVWKRVAPILGLPPDSREPDLGRIHAVVFAESRINHS